MRGPRSIATVTFERIGEPRGRQTCWIRPKECECVENLSEQNLVDYQVGLRHIAAASNSSAKPR